MAARPNPIPEDGVEEFPVLIQPLTEIDWAEVERAFAYASDRVGWNATFEIEPEEQLVWVLIPQDRLKIVPQTTFDFYGAIEEKLGIEGFRPIHVQFGVQ